MLDQHYKVCFEHENKSYHVFVRKPYLKHAEFDYPPNQRKDLFVQMDNPQCQPIKGETYLYLLSIGPNITHCLLSELSFQTVYDKYAYMGVKVSDFCRLFTADDNRISIINNQLNKKKLQLRSIVAEVIENGK